MKIESDEKLYNSKIKNTYCSLLNLLEAFPSIELPLSVFIELSDRIDPRF